MTVILSQAEIDAANAWYVRLLDIPCPSCPAKNGERCEPSASLPFLNTVHRSRVALAEASE